jgi:PAS domain-containing protein
MILRLVRSTIRPGSVPELFRQLREYGLPDRPEFRGRLTFVYGFRHAHEQTEFIAISTWRDLDSLATADGVDDGELLDDLSVDHYELVDDGAEAVVAIDGPVIGLVTGQIRPNEESTVHDMVREVTAEVTAAGVAVLHIGRRVVRGRTDLVVLAVWRDRASLHRFAQQRDRPTIDPEFAARLTDLHFTTYDCLSPERLMVPPEGPAILLADDDRRYVDASPGFEAVLGLPGELVLRRTVDDLTAPSMRSMVPGSWAHFIEVGSMAGTFELQRPDGATVPVTFRAAANVPVPGIHASVFDIPGQPRDERSIEAIVAEVFAPAAAPIR